jgi:hypothetical protein
MGLPHQIEIRNPNIETRNNFKIQISKILNFLYVLVIGILNICNCFGFRASYLEFCPLG